ncbi:hypothetical protein C7S13_5958 [Burkholderia cepacia]|nr:hypothetical protein [Burkholderia cepacia]
MPGARVPAARRAHIVGSARLDARCADCRLHPVDPATNHRGIPWKVLADPSATSAKRQRVAAFVLRRGIRVSPMLRAGVIE